MIIKSKKSKKNMTNFIVMVFNVTFNNISATLWWSAFIGGGNWNPWRKPPTCRNSLTNFIT